MAIAILTKQELSFSCFHFILLCGIAEGFSLEVFLDNFHVNWFCLIHSCCKHCALLSVCRKYHINSWMFWRYTYTKEFWKINSLPKKLPEKSPPKQFRKKPLPKRFLFGGKFLLGLIWYIEVSRSITLVKNCVVKYFAVGVSTEFYLVEISLQIFCASFSLESVGGKFVWKNVW